MHGHGKKLAFFLRQLRQLPARQGEVSVLDLGCGNGRLVTGPVAVAGFRVLGVDVHPPSIESARAEFPEASFAIGDVESYAPSDVFDAVILSDVLEHVHDPARLLTMARNSLTEGGIVLVSIPNGYGPFELEQWLVRVGVLRPLVALARSLAVNAAHLRRRAKGLPWPPEEPPMPPYNVDSGHVQHFTLGSLERLAASAGLRVVERENGGLAGGDLSYFLFYAAPKLVAASLRLADHLPAAVVSTWYFALRPAQ
jgi:SAM-dependent methyltransferase